MSPMAEPVAVSWKSVRTTAYTGSLKSTVNATLLAVVGPGVLGVSETIVGGVWSTANVPPELYGRATFPAASSMVLLAARSNRNVPLPVIEPTVTMKIVPLEAETLVTAPAAVPAAVRWKSPAATLCTGSLKTTVKIWLTAAVGPAVPGVSRTRPGGVMSLTASVKDFVNQYPYWSALWTRIV